MDDKNNSLFQIERRNQILNQLKSQGKIYVSDLQKQFNVSGATIRTDLNDLEAEGFLIRTHGGAIGKMQTKEIVTLKERHEIHTEEKLAIATKALELVSDGDSLMVDGGTTISQFISLLAKSNKNDLTVITNFIPHIHALMESNNIKTMLTGGIYDPELCAVIGMETVDFLKKFKTDKVFISATGISQDHGITYAQSQDAGIKRTMIEQSKTRILLTDSSKIGLSYFATSGSLSQMDILVTDWNITEEDCRKITNLGLKVIVAPRVN